MNRYFLLFAVFLILVFPSVSPAEQVVVENGYLNYIKDSGQVEIFCLPEQMAQLNMECVCVPVEEPPVILLTEARIPALSYSSMEGFAIDGQSLTTPDNGVMTESRLDICADYQLNSLEPGEWYVWLHGKGPGSTSDSFHYVYDSIKFGAITFSGSTSYKWINELQTGGKATLDIAYDAILRICMREDGAFFDEIMLTKDPDFTPQ